MVLLEEVYRNVIRLGETHCGSKKVEHPLLLDSMNYSRSLFSDPLKMKDLLDRFEIEPGYGSSDGSYELGKVVKAYEVVRAESSSLLFGRDSRRELRIKLDDMSVVVGQGGTGALHVCISAARQRAAALKERRDELVYLTPHYPLATGLAEQHNLTIVPVRHAVAGSIPPPQDVIEKCSLNTLACVVALPSNPIHSFWSLNELNQYRELIRHCQRLGILLIVDALFQEMNWSEAEVLEPLAVADSAKFICKIFSPSKDRPFAAGYRIGYALIDSEFYPYLASAQLLAGNSTPTLSVMWFAIDLMFRVAIAEGGLNETHCNLLTGSALFGYGVADLSAKQIFEALHEVFEEYAERVHQFYDDIRTGLSLIVESTKALNNLKVCHAVLCGNSLMLEVCGGQQKTTSRSFFERAFQELGLCLAYGECFEMPADGVIRFRVVYASLSVKRVASELSRIDEWLSKSQ